MVASSKTTEKRFVEALAAREDPQTGLVKLSIVNFLPFAEGILVLFPNMLKCLTLSNIHLESEEACRAVAEAELQYLNLINCELGDGGAALVESFREGRGPKGLGLHTSRHHDYDRCPFESSERFTSFLNALRGNSHLEKLELSGFDSIEKGILDALAAALFENKWLVYLGLQNCRLDKSNLCNVLRAISTHPSLRTLDFTGINIDMDETEATKAVAEMLSHNIIPFASSAWDKIVTPRLEYNVYRKRFHAIQEIRVPSTRAAVLASALAHVCNKPSPAFTLLRENGDIFASYSAEYLSRDVCLDHVAPTSNSKRHEKVICCE
jgi:hypothetical protein